MSVVATLRKLWSGLAMLLLVFAQSIVGSQAMAAGPHPEQASTNVGSNGSGGAIKIGFIAPLSGAAAAAGQDMVNGFNLYLDQCHHKMAGRQVSLLVENDDGNPATGIAKLQKLVNQDKVNLLSGLYLANVAYKVAPVANSYGIPFIICVSGADGLTQRKHMKWVIRTSYTASQPAHPFGDYVAKKLKYKKVVTIASDYAYGYEVVSGFQKSFEANGGKVIQKLWAPLGFTDFTDLIKSIKPDASAVFMCIVGQSAGIIPSQYKDFGPKLPLIGATTSFDEVLLDKLGDALAGGISCNPYCISLDTAPNRHFVAAFKAKYGKDPGWSSECGYTNAMWINQAIDAVHGNVEDREKLMTALKKVEVDDAPRGPLKMDSYGEVVENIYIRQVDKVNGKFDNKVIFTYPMVSQFWTWDPEEYMKLPPYGKDSPPCTYCEK